MLAQATVYVEGLKSFPIAADIILEGRLLLE